MTSIERIAPLDAAHAEASQPIGDIRVVWEQPNTFGLAHLIDSTKASDERQRAFDQHIDVLEQRISPVNNFLSINPNVFLVRPVGQLPRYAAAISIIMGGEFKHPYPALSDTQGELMDRTQILYVNFTRLRYR
jgi:hypothetical protein